jgi:primosomal protein N' (replication factor Y)
LPKLLEIVVPVPLRQRFHYLYPKDFPQRLEPGVRIRVPFGSRKLVGVFVRTVTETDTDPARLREALELLDQTPVLPPSLLNLLLWASEYYLHPPGDVIQTALPVLLRQGHPGQATERRLSLTSIQVPAADELLARAPKQQALFDLLANGQSISRPELLSRGFTAAPIRGLIDKGLADWQETPLANSPFVLRGTHSQGITPSEEQQIAVAGIGESGTYLLEGVTGSGKTEVYLRVMQKVLGAGCQALVLVPEIALTPQTVERFRERFDVPVALLHSGLTDRERLKAWQSAASGHSGIIIGTRSAIFTPMARPGLIIVDEEHDASFKQHEGFRYSARDLAVLRGHRESMPVILGSATPSIETLQNATTGRYVHLTLTHRAGRMSRETYRIVSIRDNSPAEGLARPVIDMIQREIGAGRQVLLFLNRRGFAPVLLCLECRWTASCKRCDARMTYHINQNLLICHHCGFQGTVPTTCDQCHSTALMFLGLGTQRIEKHLKALFPATPILRIDRDSTRRRDALPDMLREIRTGRPAILVGTQMLAKGHHFENVTLSVLIDVDSAFFTTDYKALERMGQLVTQVGGRAGRGDNPGQVIIQTHFPDHPALRELIEDGYGQFARSIMSERRDNHLPPFAYHALVRAQSPQRNEPLEFLNTLADQALSNDPPDIRSQVELLGPVPSAMERRAGRYRALLLISASSRRMLHDTAQAVVNCAEQNARSNRSGLRWSLDVDPTDLL